MCDHLAVTKPMDAHMQTTWYETVATLGWIAALTTNVRIMSHVYVLSYRHPLHTAKSFMTLDELSGGRAILGVGAGHLQGEFELLGLDYEARGKVTDAAIDVIRAAFADEYPDVDTPYWGHIHDGGLAPRPRQHPLPIWVGGSSKPALRRAAERGDGWLPQGTPRADMPAQIAFLLEHRKRTLGDEPIDLGTITEFLYVGDPGWDVGEQTLSGKPDYLADRLNEFAGDGREPPADPLPEPQPPGAPRPDGRVRPRRRATALPLTPHAAPHPDVRVRRYAQLARPMQSGRLRRGVGDGAEKLWSSTATDTSWNPRTSGPRGWTRTAGVTGSRTRKPTTRPTRPSTRVA